MQKIYGKHSIVEALKNPKRTLKEIHIKDETLLEFTPKGLKTFFKAEKDCLMADDLPFGDIEDIEDGPVLMLDQITDPQNLGAIIRSSACFGFRFIVLPYYKDLLKSEVVTKVASGGCEHVSLVPVVNISQSIKALQKRGYWCYGLSEDGQSFTKDIKGNVVLVLGAEGAGLRQLTKKSCDMLVKIETHPDFSTLNASCASAVAMSKVFSR